MYKKLILAAAVAGFATAASAESITYTMDPAHTQVVAQWNHFGFSNPTIHFGQVDGTVTYDPENVEASSVQVTIPLSGMDSGVEAFNEHLRTADFFDIAQHPEVTFRSTSVKALGADRMRVTGDLTMHGITRPVDLAVTVNGVGTHAMTGQPAAGFDAEATILRSDFGLDMYAPTVSDEIKLRITTEATVPAPEGE
ncbi:YceI family protein [Novilysobacter defluvii]|uniref:Polyisoprenoid-binding protein n=1 Tax=Lysobacter defluvii IMMIB APB-9 = DSM 18482 TaxID=1385515 RepID=A0A0A0M6N4_9GAMM|nr:YceI family protein [Lysobacter defluvii]KGO97687.1 polyisoprenoid-binding protein [Lysobacter defluvii IMMIB APB-9 = DSM 18482]